MHEDSVVTDPHEGQFTLHDLLILTANSWALPLAVRLHLGRNSGWAWLASFLGAAIGFALTWQWKKLEWRLWRKQMTAPKRTQLTGRDRAVIRRLFFGVVVGSMLVQSLLYYACAFVIHMRRT